MPIKDEKLSLQISRKHEEFLHAVEKWNLDDSKWLQKLNEIYTVQLSELSEQDIDLYVENFMKRVGSETPEAVRELRQRIRMTYDLEDLAKRPVLLNELTNSFYKGFWISR